MGIIVKLLCACVSEGIAELERKPLLLLRGGGAEREPANQSRKLGAEERERNSCLPGTSGAKRRLVSIRP